MPYFGVRRSPLSTSKRNDAVPEVVGVRERVVRERHAEVVGARHEHESIELEVDEARLLRRGPGRGRLSRVFGPVTSTPSMRWIAIPNTGCVDRLVASA